MDDKKTYKIAIASEDGIAITLHFGKALKFYVYTYSDDQELLDVEVRDVSGAFGEDEKEDDANFEVRGCHAGGGCMGRTRTISMLSDCKCVVAGRIGEKVARNLEKNHITPFEVIADIDYVLDKLNKYISGNLLSYL